jgi:uncharacterized membrane protein
MTQMPPPALMHDIWMSGLSLCLAAWGWILLTRWGNSESAFFGVRTVKKFEDSFEAQNIDSRYLHEIFAVTGVGILVSVLLRLYFRQLLPATRPYDFWPLGLLQALGVRIAYWRARNRTLPFAAPADAVRTADLVSLAAPSRMWNLFYWPSAYLPLLSLAILGIYLRFHWASVQLPYTPVPAISESSTPNEWSLGVVLRTYRLPIIAVLIDVAGVLLAHAFSFRSRISEWDRDADERWSYRKLLMTTTVASTWVITGFAIVFGLHLQILPKRLDTTLDQLWLVAIAACYLLLMTTPLCLPFLLYYKRPVGVVSQAQDKYWKFGLYYFNPQDGAWIVPARFGAGLMLNFGQPLAWALILIAAIFLGLNWLAGIPPAAALR